MNRRIVFSLISICSVVGMVSGSALAAFTSSASNNGNTFGSGTLSLSINSATGSASTPVFSVTNAAPGDTTPVQVLNLKNEGSVSASTLTLSSISLAGNTDLASNLTLTLAIDANDDNIIDGPEIVNTAALTSGSWNSLAIGGTLTGGATRKVLAQVHFESSAPDSVQGVSSTFGFNFLASQ